MAKKSTFAKELEAFRKEADELDERRQAQIRNQAASINRLLQNGDYETEMKELHEELARTQALLFDVQAELKMMKGEDEDAI